jgi:hypothetical protein
MKNLQVLSAQNRAKEEEAYLNLYLAQPFKDSMWRDTLKEARDRRSSVGGGGITIRVFRTATGDFLIERVEEF